MSGTVGSRVTSPVAAHLARALEQHRRWCQANGHAIPPDLLTLARIVCGGQERSSSQPDLPPVHDAPVPLAVDAAEAARLLGVSPSTLGRLVRAGRIRSVPIGRSRRFPVDELRRFLAAELDPSPKETQS